MTNSMEELLGKKQVQKLHKRGFEDWRDVSELLAGYFYQLSHARVQLQSKFTESDLVLMVDACWGDPFQPLWSGVLVGQMEDYLYLEDICSEEQLNEHPLIKRLKSLTPFEEYALRDAIVCFQKESRMGEKPDIATMLKR